MPRSWPETVQGVLCRRWLRYNAHPVYTIRRCQTTAPPPPRPAIRSPPPQPPPVPRPQTASARSGRQVLNGQSKRSEMLYCLPKSERGNLRQRGSQSRQPVRRAGRQAVSQAGRQVCLHPSSGLSTRLTHTQRMALLVAMCISSPETARQPVSQPVRRAGRQAGRQAGRRACILQVACPRFQLSDAQIAHSFAAVASCVLLRLRQHGRHAPEPV